MATMRWEKTHLEDDQVTTEVFASAKLTAAKARATVSNLVVIVMGLWKLGKRRCILRSRK